MDGQPSSHATLATCTFVLGHLNHTMCVGECVSCVCRGPRPRRLTKHLKSDVCHLDIRTSMVSDTMCFNVLAISRCDLCVLCVADR